jgi:hypothetical protein
MHSSVSSRHSNGENFLGSIIHMMTLKETKDSEKKREEEEEEEEKTTTMKYQLRQPRRSAKRFSHVLAKPCLVLSSLLIVTHANKN